MLRGACALVPFTIAALLATPSDAADPNAIEVIVVTGTARSDVQSIDANQIQDTASSTVADVLEKFVPSAFLSDTESNPFQPDLYFRGFDASPVLGTPEGLAVYQGGARINQAFGGTVLWDLVPTFAIAHIDIVPGSDPIFGLNALGGAVALRMKTGFDAPTSEAAASAGSFGHVKLVGETAGVDGDEAFYVGATVDHEDGWRRSSPSNLVQAYGDYSVRGGQASADLNLTVAEDWLSENAAIPVQAETTAAFSIPDTARDRVVFLQGNGEYDWSSQLAFRTAAYLRWTQVYTTNGQASGFAPCTSDPTLLCAGDDPTDPLSTTDGSVIPASLGGNATIGVQTTDTRELGATAELDGSTDVAGLDNAATLGATFEYATSNFESSTLLANNTFQPGGATAVPLGISVGGAGFQVDLGSANTDAGVYAQDTLNLTSSLSLQVAGRFNYDRIGLTDHLGASLSGTHTYLGLNPSAELAWRIDEAARLYARVGQSSRTPTAAELSCADPTQPCLFPLSFISDPGLRKVVSQTIELGAKGKSELGELSATWSADLYETRNQDDILFVSTGTTIGAGYFANVGATQRRGVDAALEIKWSEFDARVSYAYVDATFQSAFSILSAFNPGADPNGDIFVKPGDELPNIPRNLGKVELGYQPTPKLHLDVGARVASAQFLRGDEANLEKPLAGYTVFDAEAEYQFTSDLSFFVSGDNILDTRYATFGLFGDPTGGGALPQFTNPRFIVPAAPFVVSVGIRAVL